MAYKLYRTGDSVRDLLDAVENKTIYPDATQQEHGLLSTEDKTKLDSLYPPIVRFGRWWLYSPEYQRYISTPLMANESDNNLWMLTESGQTITHDFNTLPSVTTMTLMDNKLQQILLNVTYPTKNTIQVNWNGDMTVYVYII